MRSDFLNLYREVKKVQGRKYAFIVTFQTLLFITFFPMKTPLKTAPLTFLLPICYNF